MSSSSTKSPRSAKLSIPLLPAGRTKYASPRGCTAGGLERSAPSDLRLPGRPGTVEVDARYFGFTGQGIEGLIHAQNLGLDRRRAAHAHHAEGVVDRTAGRANLDAGVFGRFAALALVTPATALEASAAMVTLSSRSLDIPRGLPYGVSVRGSTRPPGTPIRSSSAKASLIISSSCSWPG